MRYFIRTSFFKEGDSYDERKLLSFTAYQEMASRWPEFHVTGLHGLHVKIEVGSSLQDEVFCFLAAHGRTPCWSKYPSAKSETDFVMSGERIFGPEDLVGCELVTLGPRKQVSELVMYHADCDVWLDGQTIDPAVTFGGGGACNLPIVTTDVRDQIQAAGWGPLTFRPVEIRDAKPDQGSLWLMWPDHEMPPMLNEVVDSAGRPFDPETSDQCYIQDLYGPWLFRYAKKDLNLPDGCFAFRTRERFGSNKVYWGRATRKPDIIVKLEFSEWLKSKGWVEALHPVVLE